MAAASNQSPVTRKTFDRNFQISKSKPVNEEIKPVKTMTCMQLGGACDQSFSAETFDEIAELSKQHGIHMFQQNDAAHLAAMDQMRSLMQDPVAMQRWFDERRQAFEALPDDPA